MLVLALGKATKLLPLLHDDSKRYVFELVVGTKTNTGDASGTVIEKSPVPPGWQAALAQLAASFVGQLTQIPPMHSALKIDGQPLYRAARAGQEVARAPRTVTIGELRVIACEATTARLVVQCSAGTYVRTLCEQLGQRLEVPAHMGALLRVAAGPFTISQSVRPDQISRDVNSTLIDPLTVLRNERFEIDTAGATRFLHGNEVQVHADERTDRLTEGTDSRSEVLVTRDGALIGCGYLVRRDGRPPLIAPSRVLATQ